MTPMDEFAQERARQMQEPYEKAMRGTELKAGRQNLHLSGFDVSNHDRLVFKFTITASEPDEEDILRSSVVTFPIDMELWEKYDFIQAKWEKFCSGLGIDAKTLNLVDAAPTFQEKFFEEFRGDVSIREKDGRFHTDVTILSFTGNVVGKPPF